MLTVLGIVFFRMFPFRFPIFFSSSNPISFLHRLSSAYCSTHSLAWAVTVLGFHAQSCPGERNGIYS